MGQSTRVYKSMSKGIVDTAVLPDKARSSSFVVNTALVQSNIEAEGGGIMVGSTKKRVRE